MSSRPGHSPRRQRRRRSRGRSNAADGGEEDKTSSPVPSPGSWNVDRGRSRVRRPSNPFSEDNLRRRGYHSLLSSFGKVFHVEKRWKLVREMGSGAYGVVISAADDISSETVAIKMVTRVFDKVQLAKRALREVTLLRHFNSHENITGLIDVDAISPDFNEIRSADLHQIIKSGQTLSNEHVQYFLYQILRGMKFIHSAGVIHRDLKPGNLLVNADCELKICDFGLARGFDAAPDENATKLTEYVATRWYRAPEIMLAFTQYNTAIDVWSIGCILAELMLGKPLFKGKDYVDQLNKILDVLGSPEERIVRKIGSDKAQAYVRSLPFKKTIPFRRLLPTADSEALDVMSKMLAFDPSDRIDVFQALEHPWLAAYHDEADEPTCLTKFERWRELEKLETIEELKTALWNEIEDYRREVRGIHLLPPITRTETPIPLPAPAESDEKGAADMAPNELTQSPKPGLPPDTPASEPEVKLDLSHTGGPSQIVDKDRVYTMSPVQYRKDPVVNYGTRRSSILQPSRQGSTFNSPIPSSQHLPTFLEDYELSSLPPSVIVNPTIQSTLGPGTVAFPTSQPQGYVVPARSRTGSTAGGPDTVVGRRLLRTLSTVSIHDSSVGRTSMIAGNGSSR
ncbi:Pkinase-domain-containing protein [Coprinellus micaceus]|uniref:Pkinase-domain-containing protein n=1 Tax=Coprinellus micaceus TaxID=71717 RepID=A0A4Y7TQQ0_COPMI|nr:Pkinase-domain-containing protein [Coprinellus micaceus]